MADEPFLDIFFGDTMTAYKAQTREDFNALIRNNPQARNDIANHLKIEDDGSIVLESRNTSSFSAYDGVPLYRPPLGELDYNEVRMELGKFGFDAQQIDAVIEHKKSELAQRQEKTEQIDRMLGEMEGNSEPAVPDKNASPGIIWGVEGDVSSRSSEYEGVNGMIISAFGDQNPPLKLACRDVPPLEEFRHGTGTAQCRSTGGYSLE